MLNLILRNKAYILILIATAATAGLITVALGFAYQYTWALIKTAMLKEKELIFIITLLSITLSFTLIQYFSATKSRNSDIHLMLETLHLRAGHLSMRETTVRTLASTTSIMLSGTAGLEGPAIVAGGGIGAAISRLFKVPFQKQRKIYLAGVAAGFSALFKAPFTAILFAIEIPYKRDVEKEAFVEAAVASALSYSVAVVLGGITPIFYLPSTPSLNLNVIAHSIILGVICGLYSAFFVRVYNLADSLGRRSLVRGGFGLLLLIGGLSLGLIGFINFESIGAGYETVENLASNKSAYTIPLLLTLTILRLFSTTIFLNFGGSGGLLTPTIVEGALIGASYSIAVTQTIESTYLAVGMAAMLSGTHKIFLAPAAFIAETAGPYAIIPGLLASLCSFFASGSLSLFPSQPSAKVYEEELALERIYGKASKIAPQIISRLKASDVMSDNPITLTEDENVATALKKFEAVPYRVLPIVDSGRRPIGVVRLEELVSASRKSLKLPVLTTYAEKPVTVPLTTPLNEVVTIMLNKNADHIYVVDNKGELIGVIAKIDIARSLIRYYTTY
ncbi:MAG: chloride channel protein [Nitrososphaerales archaeon]